MSGRRIAVVSALALAACAAPEVGRVDAAQLRTPRALVVTVDDAERALRLLGPWPTDTPPDPIALTDDEVSLWLVGIDPAALEGQVSALDREGPLVPRLGAPCSGPPPARLDRDVVPPEDAPALGVTPGSGGVERRARGEVPALRAIVLRGALDYARCRRAGEERLSPFGRAPALVPEDVTVGGAPLDLDRRAVVGAARIDRDRLVVITLGAALLVRRGGAYADVEGNARAWPWVASRFGQPALIRTGSVTTVVVPASATATSAVWEVPVLADGLGPVATATLADVRLRAVSTSPEGELVVVGDDGVVMVREAGAAALRRTAQLGLDLISVIHTPNPRAPHVIGTADAAVFEGDARTGRFERRNVGNSARRFDVHSLAWTTGATGLDLWAGTTIGLYARRDGGEWTEVRLDVPPALDRCASEANACGAHDIVEQIGHMAVDRREAARERLFLSVRTCGGWIALDPRTGCVAALTADGGPSARVPLTERTADLAVEGGVLTVITLDGHAHELALAP